MSKVTRIPGTDTPTDEWSDEAREGAYRVADLLSLISGKRINLIFLKKNKDGHYVEEVKN